MKIYLAIPYTGFEEESFAVANKVAAKLMKEGHFVFSPISHTHPIALAGKLPTDYEFWKKYNTLFIEWCECVYVVCMFNDGVKRICLSEGVRHEMSVAKSLFKEVIIIEEQ